VWQRVEPLLRSRFPTLEAILTEAPGDAERRAAGFARAHPAGLLVVVGGDGSIHEAVNGLLDAGYDGTLAIIPAGTGNDVARNLGIPPGPAEAARLDPARARPIDVGRVTTWNKKGDERHRWFLNSLSIGASARANRIAGSIGGLIRGPAKYPIAGGLALLASGPEHFEVLVAGELRHRGRAINLTIANGACFGGGLRISPDSRPDDGQLDLVIIGNLSRLRALGALRALRSGRHVTMPGVEVVPAAPTPIEIHTRRPLRFEADGENLDSHERIIVNLHPRRLRIAR
jgi:diacylglycerol kinase (ATP)